MSRMVLKSTSPLFVLVCLCLPRPAVAQTQVSTGHSEALTASTTLCESASGPFTDSRTDKSWGKFTCGSYVNEVYNEGEFTSFATGTCGNVNYCYPFVGSLINGGSSEHVANRGVTNKDSGIFGCYSTTTVIYTRNTAKVYSSNPICRVEGQCDAYLDEICADQEMICFEGVCSFGSPIIIPTGLSQAYRLTNVSNGVLFDITGDGIPERMAWTEAGTELAFLAMDRDGDGLITSGRELFGNFTVPGMNNGFDALAALSGQQGEAIASTDPWFKKLLLWTDRNHDGISQFDEIVSADSVLKRIGLKSVVAQRRDDENLFKFQGWAETLNRTISIYDVILNAKR